jgi:hypothetical protein
VAYVLLPAGVIWLILRLLAELPPENNAVRTAETVFALASLYLLLRVVQTALMSLIDEKMRGQSCCSTSFASVCAWSGAR